MDKKTQNACTESETNTQYIMSLWVNLCTLCISCLLYFIQVIKFQSYYKFCH